MILAIWHSRKVTTRETIKRSIVARDFWGGMNRWPTVQTWVILKCQYGQLCACVEAGLWGQSFTIQFCYELKIALKKNETKIHQATRDQYVIKGGILLKDIFQCQPFFKSFYLNLLQYWSCFMFWCFGWGMQDLSSLTGDQACTPCIGKWSLNHWTTREAPKREILKWTNRK